MDKDPKQYTNLDKNLEYAKILEDLKSQHKQRLAEIMDCDVVKDPPVTRGN